MAYHFFSVFKPCDSCSTERNSELYFVSYCTHTLPHRPPEYSRTYIQDHHTIFFHTTYNLGGGFIPFHSTHLHSMTTPSSNITPHTYALQPQLSTLKGLGIKLSQSLWGIEHATSGRSGNPRKRRQSWGRGIPRLY